MAAKSNVTALIEHVHAKFRANLPWWHSQHSQRQRRVLVVYLCFGRHRSAWWISQAEREEWPSLQGIRSLIFSTGVSRPRGQSVEVPKCRGSRLFNRPIQTNPPQWSHSHDDRWGPES